MKSCVASADYADWNSPVPVPALSGSEHYSGSNDSIGNDVMMFQNDRWGCRWRTFYQAKMSWNCCYCSGVNSCPYSSPPSPSSFPGPDDVVSCPHGHQHCQNCDDGGGGGWDRGRGRDRGDGDIDMMMNT